MSELVATIRKVLAEGEAIVDRTRAMYGIEERLRMGPRERAWLRGDFGRPAPEEESPDYYLIATDRIDVTAVRVLLRVARSTRRPGTRAGLLRSAGRHLARLRSNHDRLEWIELVRREVGLGKSRAYAIIRTSRGDAGRCGEKLSS